MSDHLRPLERRVLALHGEGESVEESARRFKRSPQHIERVLVWAQIPRSGPPPGLATRAKEQRVLAMRLNGESHDDIGERFNRSPRFIRQMEGLAHYRRAREILG